VRVPQNMVTDTGFYAQASKMIRPRKTEAYVASSVVFGDKSAGYRTSYDFIQGINFFLIDTRNSRINLHVIEVYRAPRPPILATMWGDKRA
jgi:Pyruvate/2-oxoacid:ferredoxin oxidoreductase gamma subunit